MRPGIKEIKENCIMHKRSHREPKNNICVLMSTLILPRQALDIPLAVIEDI